MWYQKVDRVSRGCAPNNVGDFGHGREIVEACCPIACFRCFSLLAILVSKIRRSVLFQFFVLELAWSYFSRECSNSCESFVDPSEIVYLQNGSNVEKGDHHPILSQKHRGTRSRILGIPGSIMWWFSRSMARIFTRGNDENDFKPECPIPNNCTCAVLHALLNRMVLLSLNNCGGPQRAIAAVRKGLIFIVYRFEISSPWTGHDVFEKYEYADADVSIFVSERFSSINLSSLGSQKVHKMIRCGLQTVYLPPKLFENTNISIFRQKNHQIVVLKNEKWNVCAEGFPLGVVETGFQASNDIVLRAEWFLSGNQLGAAPN